MEVRRGDIFMANLTSHNVDYACGVRPVLIVQNDKGNAHSDSYIAAVITSKPKKYLPTHFKLDSRCGLRKNSTVLCEHLITVKRFMLMDYIGTIVNTECVDITDNTKVARLSGLHNTRKEQVEKQISLTE